MAKMAFLDKQLQIYAPIDRACRCIDVWLKEEGRVLHKRDQKRLAGLMARYFYYEEGLTDELMMSFLRHYAGSKVIDMDNPAEIRQEIQSVLDQASFRREDRGMSYQVLLALSSILIFVAVCFAGYQVINLPMTTAQQDMLKAKVQQVTASRPGMAASTVWARVKKPLNIKSYQDMTFWQYDDALAEIDLLLAP